MGQTSTGDLPDGESGIFLKMGLDSHIAESGK
jgi:hypothetical protein